MTRHVVAAILLAAPAWAGATRLSAQEQPGHVVARLESAASDSSLGSGYARGLAPFLDDSVVFLYPGAPVVRGADAARRLLEAVRELRQLRVSWVPETIRVSADTTLAFVWGRTITVPAADPTRTGRYAAVWRNGPGGWRVVALAAGGTLPRATSGWPAQPFPRTIPPAAERFAAADSSFAALAGDSGAAAAFFHYAAPDAVTFRGDGSVNRGPAAIREALRGSTAAWRWWPVAGGAARGGDMGWTVGEAEITPASGATGYSKYLTVWRSAGDGARFLVDAGSGRPAPGR